MDCRSQASAAPAAHAPAAAPSPPHHPGPRRAGAERLSRGRAANKVAARAQRGDGVRRARPGGGEVPVEEDKDAVLSSGAGGVWDHLIWVSESLASAAALTSELSLPP